MRSGLRHDPPTHLEENSTVPAVPTVLTVRAAAAHTIGVCGTVSLDGSRTTGRR